MSPRPESNDVPPLLEVRGLSVHHGEATWGGLGQRVVRAVEDVSFTLAAGGVLGLVGESGSGKTTIARAIVRLVEPHAGVVLWRGRPVSALSPRSFLPLRKEIQLVFQDPLQALNPRRTVAEILGEPLVVHARHLGAADRRDRAAEALRRVHLSPDLLHRFPRELSGGQRQRVNLARALAVEPALLVLDEPLSALDVSLQARMLDLLAEVRATLGLALLMISHDLAVVEELGGDVCVLRAGRVVEQGPVARVFSEPAHPYTRALVAAVPRLSLA